MHLKGYSIFKSTCEPQSDLTNCPAILCVFFNVVGDMYVQENRVILGLVGVPSILIILFVHLAVIICIKTFFIQFTLSGLFSTLCFT